MGGKCVSSDAVEEKVVEDAVLLLIEILRDARGINVCVRETGRGPCVAVVVELVPELMVMIG